MRLVNLNYTYVPKMHAAIQFRRMLITEELRTDSSASVIWQ